MSLGDPLLLDFHHGLLEQLMTVCCDTRPEGGSHIAEQPRSEILMTQFPSTEAC